MNEMKIIIIGIFLISTAFGFFLKYLTYSRRNAPLPENVRDVFDEETYKKNLAYEMANLRFSIVGGIIGTIYALLILVFNVHNYLYDWISGHTGSVYLTSLFIIGVPIAVGAVIGILEDIYSTFVIEEKYGFNKYTPGRYAWDTVKEILVAVVIGGGLFTLFIWLHEMLGNTVFIVFFVVLLAFSLLMRFLSPLLIRLFYKLTPLEDGSLKDKVQALADKTGYKFKAIYVVDASQKSTKLNAFATGYGKTKTIGLFDTLIEKMSEEEVIAVLAHEIGHAKKGHILTSAPLSFLSLAMMMALAFFVVTMPAVSQAFGFADVNIAFGIYVLFIMVSPLMLLMQIPTAALSRKHEYEADAIAKELAGGEVMVSALKTLYRESFGNLTPHPFVVMMEYSHPPLTDRVRAIEEGR